MNRKVRDFSSQSGAVLDSFTLTELYKATVLYIGDLAKNKASIC